MSNFPVFDPASPQAKAITDLFNVLLIICSVIFAVVSGLIVYSLIRFRSRSDAEPPQTSGNKLIEVAWTVIPFLLLVYIFAATARAMSRSDPLPSTKPPDLIVVAHQWWWEARYPSGVITANEIHIPLQKTLLVRLESADVIHDFWAPALGRKMDMVPGHPNYIWLRSDRPGTFLGFCAEYCGAQHAGMRFRVVAQAPAEFDKWQAQQLQAASQPPVEAAGDRELFEKLTCANCHVIDPNVPSPQAGPNLAHLGTRRMLAGEVLQNNPENLKRWLLDPQKFKPGCLMPNLHLTDEQAQLLAKYLSSLQ